MSSLPNWRHWSCVSSMHSVCDVYVHYVHVCFVCAYTYARTVHMSYIWCWCIYVVDIYHWLEFWFTVNIFFNQYLKIIFPSVIFSLCWCTTIIQLHMVTRTKRMTITAVRTSQHTHTHITHTHAHKSTILHTHVLHNGNGPCCSLS